MLLQYLENALEELYVKSHREKGKEARRGGAAEKFIAVRQCNDKQ